MTEQEKEQALKELKAVMAKWNLGFFWDCSPYSDLHGVTGQEVSVYCLTTRENLFTEQGESFSHFDL
jgi:hypothetical protein